MQITVLQDGLVIEIHQQALGDDLRHPELVLIAIHVIGEIRVRLTHLVAAHVVSQTEGRKAIQYLVRHRGADCIGYIVGFIAAHEGQSDRRVPVQVVDAAPVLHALFLERAGRGHDIDRSAAHVVDEVRGICRHLLADPLAHQQSGSAGRGASRRCNSDTKDPSGPRESPLPARARRKDPPTQPKGADSRAQLHPHPPPSATVAPRAPSRTSWTCCRYLSDRGSRETLISGSASQPRSYGLTHGSTAQPPRHKHRNDRRYGSQLHSLSNSRTCRSYFCS